MAKTPRFVNYNTAQFGREDVHFIIHMYQPRFVGKVTIDGDTLRVFVHELWDECPEDQQNEICRKMKEWFYFQFVKPGQ